MNPDLPFAGYDLADVTEKQPARTKTKRADYLLGRASAYMRDNHYNGPLIILLSPMLGDVAGVLKSITQIANVTVEVTDKLHGLNAGIQGKA